MGGCPTGLTAPRHPGPRTPPGPGPGRLAPQTDPGLVGYLVGFAAIVGTDDIDDTVEALTHHVSNDEIIRRTTFAERVRRRRIEGKIA
jgi:hypothetical protein